METENIRRTSLHGPSQNGRNDDLGYMRQLIYRPPHSANPLHHCQKNDERTSQVASGGTSSIHLQSSVSPMKQYEHEIG